MLSLRRNSPVPATLEVDDFDEVAEPLVPPAGSPYRPLFESVNSRDLPATMHALVVLQEHWGDTDSGVAALKDAVALTLYRYARDTDRDRDRLYKMFALREDAPGASGLNSPPAEFAGAEQARGALAAAGRRGEELAQVASVAGQAGYHLVLAERLAAQVACAGEHALRALAGEQYRQWRRAYGRRGLLPTRELQDILMPGQLAGVLRTWLEDQRGTPEDVAELREAVQAALAHAVAWRAGQR